MSAFFPICETLARYGLSPNGRWIAVVCSGENNAGPFVRVFSTDQVFDWEILYDIGDDGAYYRTPFLVHWSNDGRYLYLTSAPEVDCWLCFYGGDELLRLDLFTGSVSEILQRDDNAGTFYDFSFAPGDNRLAYIYSESLPLELNIVDTQSDKTTTIPLDEEIVMAGSMRWSPGEDQIIYAAATDYLDEASFLLVVLNLSDSMQRVIPTLKGQRMDPVEWKDEHTIVVRSLDGSGRLWTLDLGTGEFIAQ